ncbi:CU044_5270 family protein [Kitasatospora sp. NPDC006697]|uniref:CU044_5270 family protein n=1 Tax=Kitasatospora sp. NPDC006697 TaxID=3364020 RepID=UPI0036840130
MNEINEDRAPRPAAPVRRPRRRLAWAALPVLAGGLALALVLPSGGGPAPTAGAQGAPAGVGTPGSATALLERVADVAAAQPVATVKDGQFAYVKSLVQYSMVATDSSMVPVRVTLGKLRSRQTWTSADGSRPGLILDPDGPQPKAVTDPVRHPSMADPTPDFVAALPTDPDALLKLIYAAGPTEQAKGPDQQAFAKIGDLLRNQVAPPAVSAALYRAGAKIPGVTLVEDATDASGRHGLAVAEQVGDLQQQWIFDPVGYAFLGDREVVTTAGPWGKPGDVISQSAVLGRAAVAKAGDLPRG